jgi:hypothetical protein
MANDRLEVVTGFCRMVSSFFFMIKCVLTHHPIHPILSNVPQKVNYLKTFFHFSILSDRGVYGP